MLILNIDLPKRNEVDFRFICTDMDFHDEPLN